MRCMHGWELTLVNSPLVDPLARTHCARRHPKACVLASPDRHAKGSRRTQVAVHVRATRCRALPSSLTHNSPQGGPRELLASDVFAQPPGQVYTTPRTTLAAWHKPTDTWPRHRRPRLSRPHLAPLALELSSLPLLHFAKRGRTAMGAF